MTDTSARAVEILEGELRELIQQREVPIGPSGDPELVRLVHEAVADYQDRFLHGGLPSLDDDAIELLHHRVAGFGLLTPLLEDPDVEEVWINEPGRVFVARRGKPELTTIVLAPGEVEEVVERMLARAGRRLDRSQPFVDARLPDGSRLHVVVPPVTDHWAVNIRKFVNLRAHTLDELVHLHSLSVGAAALLAASIRVGLNVVVAGAVGAGKTTLLNCLAGAVPSDERIVTCEEVFELSIGRPDVVAMQCRQPNLEGAGTISLRDLVRESLRMRPDRIVVGEVRGPEALDMLLTLNSGAGGMTSVHATSARDALRKLVTLPLLAGGNIDREFVASTVAACVDLVVFCQRRGDRREVSEILAVGEPNDHGEPTAGTIFKGSGRDLGWTGELPRRVERFCEHGIEIQELLA